MASSIKLTNANGKVLTLSHQDTHNEDNVVDVLSTAYTIETINDFATVPAGFKTVIVKDINRGGTFVWSAAGTANGGTVFAGAAGYWTRQYSGAVNIKWFGAKGDGVTDDTVAIQNAINFIFANKLNITSDSSTFIISATLVIPQNTLSPTFITSNKISLDFGNAIFKLSADVTLFQSDNYGSVLDSAYSVYVELRNFGIESSIGQIIQPAIKVQDWHQNCIIENIVSNVNQQMLWANNCYYTTFNNISAGIIAPKAGDRFIWFNNTNLCNISKLVAVNAITGYRFDGAVTATSLSSMSVEGQTQGIVFNSSVYDVEIRDSYIENFSDIAIVFNSYAEGVSINNNYINFLSSASSYLLYYNPLPGTNIYISSNNRYEGIVSKANIIKNKEDAYGHGVKIEYPNSTGSSISDLLVDNTIIGTNINISENRNIGGLIGHVNNVFAIGNYSGKYTNGYANSNGFIWVNNSNTTLLINTKVKQNFVQLLYVNIEVSFIGGTTYIKGLFIGNSFYKFDAVGMVASTDLTGGTDPSGFFKIDGGYYFAGNITGCKGEVRMI